MALVLLPLLLDGREHRGLHECRDRDRDPVLRGDIPDGDGTARLHGPVALGPQPGPQRLQAGLAKCRRPLIGPLLQDAPHGTPRPQRVLPGPPRPPAGVGRQQPPQFGGRSPPTQEKPWRTPGVSSGMISKRPSPPPSYFAT